MRRPMSKRLRFRVLRRDGFACRYCGRRAPLVVLHVDHVLAVANGGTDDEANLGTSCADCNLGKYTTGVVFTSAPFLVWLAGQADRDDVVGDLAADHLRTPMQGGSLRETWRWLRGVGACDGALSAAWHAWREYRRHGAPTRMVAAMQRETLKAIRENAAGGECLHLRSGFMVGGKLYGDEVAP